MEEQFLSINSRILNEMLDPPAVKRTGTAHNSMHLITFFQKQLGQVGTILSGDARNKSFF